ncbi:hypothetical protein GQ55_5G211400 [Panicum hallii var. hallii]|uniref:Uncharacterized protein n=1 Tax=Panicum hallii var. hallii TaxID=1504633 RepID=A0A2T7DIM6_9POAL|nr:hypothetical protein GQ55_5G211400 [Panicum hallii var. hallii]
MPATSTPTKQSEAHGFKSNQHFFSTVTGEKKKKPSLCYAILFHSTTLYISQSEALLTGC